MLRFEWDDEKNRANIIKHEVDFDEASTVFWDENAILFDDPDHSISEDRFIVIGISAGARLLIVCHCYREEDEVIRIISARKATRKESERYARGI